MTDDGHADLTGEREREHEAATAGIVARPAVLDVDSPDDELVVGDETGDADDGDDEAVEDDDEEPVEPDV
jgi:hypothetical protein